MSKSSTTWACPSDASAVHPQARAQRSQDKSGLLMRDANMSQRSDNRHAGMGNGCTFVARPFVGGSLKNGADFGFDSKMTRSGKHVELLEMSLVNLKSSVRNDNTSYALAA